MLRALLVLLTNPDKEIFVVSKWGVRVMISKTHEKEDI